MQVRSRVAEGLESSKMTKWGDKFTSEASVTSIHKLKSFITIFTTVFTQSSFLTVGVERDGS